MAVFEKVRLEADKESYPILLSNGNLAESGDLDDKRHFAVWSGEKNHELITSKRTSMKRICAHPLTHILYT